MDRVTLDNNDFHIEGNPNFGFSAFNLNSTLEEHGTLHAPGEATDYQSSNHEATMNDFDRMYPPSYSATSGGQFAADGRDGGSQFPSEGDSLIRDLSYDQISTGDGSIGTEYLLEQQYGWGFGAWPQGAFSTMDGNGNSTIVPQHSSLPSFCDTNVVQDLQLPVDGLAAPAATSESDVTVISMINEVRTAPNKDWLAPKRKFQRKHGNFYCPQCLLDLWRGSEELTRQQLENPGPNWSLKYYSRNRDVRRHLKKDHKCVRLQ